MKAKVKIFTYHFPIEKVQHLTVREAENEAIKLALSASKGNEIVASSLLGISHDALQSKL
ncbi:MAG: hypothetical protein HQK92_14345, partial [Nitrospirae bacterium]|nr:hypothetical protein [Nitrospirota bacterium]